MTVTYQRIKRDIQELAETVALQKQMEDVEKELAKAREEIRELKREVASLSKKMATLGLGGTKVKTHQLIDVIEDIACGLEQPVKVVELRELLINDGRVRSKAENFYSVIVTAMNNSPKFEKISSGVYKYIRPSEQSEI
ncbi:MAG: hypothetical protein WCX65_11045 [bacterium]